MSRSLSPRGGAPDAELLPEIRNEGFPFPACGGGRPGRSGAASASTKDEAMIVANSQVLARMLPVIGGGVLPLEGIEAETTLQPRWLRKFLLVWRCGVVYNAAVLGDCA